MTEEAQTWKAEVAVLFTRSPVVVAACNELTLSAQPPLLMYCPESCISMAIQNHEALLQHMETLSSKTGQFGQTHQQSQVDEKGPKLNNEEPDYRIADIGQRL